MIPALYLVAGLVVSAVACWLSYKAGWRAGASETADRIYAAIPPEVLQQLYNRQTSAVLDFLARRPDMNVIVTGVTP